jgi:hypothetical protein
VTEYCCETEWECDEWSDCVDFLRWRSCYDINNCEPYIIEEEYCCEPNWECTEWGVCRFYTQTRTCEDTNICNDNTNKPEEFQYCDVP